MNTSRMIANRFGIGGLIGQGSMGEVYRGLDTQTNDLVAIKALKQMAVKHDPDTVERFVREGEALRRLNHPNIVKVLTSALEGDRHYIVMEYVGGGSLDKLLKRERPLLLARALEIAIDLADALVRAHRVKIIHRDIKPQNVLLAEDGTPRLTDFGVAHMSDMSTITQSGALVGTMPYLSPEAWQFDEPNVGTDIWAFGVMLYEMLAGQRPFDADQPSKLKRAILHQPLPNLREFRPDVPPALAELIGRMLEKDHTQRIGSMRVVGAELEAITRRTEQWPIDVLLGQALGAPAAPSAPPLSAAVARSADLDLTIASTGVGYTVRLRAAQGGAEGQPQDFAPPFDLATLPRRRRDVADWVKQARIRRLRANEELRQARDFGAALFEQLFTGAVLEGFHASRAALPHGDRLRLRLRVPPDLALIPWELLFDPHAEQFLALAPDLTLLRSTDALAPVAPLHLDGPLQVVVVLASPVGADYPPIQLDRELRRIETVLKGSHTQSQVALDVIRGPGTLDQLRTRLRTPLHVLHVLCHGDLDEARGGVLIFEDTDGAPEPVGADLLRALLQRRQPRLVLLNACLGALPGGEDPFSSVGAGLLAGGVPAVIAMQFELAEDAAVELARVFYAELAAGMPVDMALAEARLHLFGCYPTRLDWAIPVLFLRTDSGALFAVPPPPTRETVLPVPAAVPPPVERPSPRQTIVEQRTLQRLWHLALTAYVTRDWERAAELLEQVAGLKPDHEDVQARLVEARRQLALPPLYRQALALRDDDHWQTALEVLSELERQQPDYRDAEGVRAWAERRQRREQRYRTALEASVRGDWAAAIVALDVLLAESPDDREASALLARAHAEQQATMAREQQRRAEAQHQRPEPDRRRLGAGTRDPRARYGPPIDYIERGEFAAALNLLDEMLRQDSANRAATELASTLIERLDVPLDQRLRAATLAARVDDLRPGVGTLEPAWCVFPAGQYVIGAQRDPHNNAACTPQRVGLEAFQIARYPITVRQFQRFWEDSMGYANRQWWTPQGWAWKQGHGVTQPYRWGDYDWMALNQPVIGVSWYEAMAFCAWLTQRRHVMGLLRRGQLIRLPSEAEWEVAATWDRRVGQLRAWRPPEGEFWQNAAETRIGHASPVGLFPEGVSPCGALDMAGNVWEWCGSRHSDYPQEAGRLPGDFTPSEEGPALRGGAYNTPGAQAGWSARTWYFASQHQQSAVGFRVVLVSKGFW
ncbi:MAG: protein kinase domain-containing protein [Roseiflexaceae bacterium]